MPQNPPIVGIDDPNPDVLLAGEPPVVDPAGTTLQDLYPEDPGVVGPTAPTIADPTGATVTETDPSVAEVGTPGVAGPTTVGGVTGATVTETDPSVAEVGTPGVGVADPTGAISAGQGIDASQTGLSSEQQVDAELARILGQDS